MSRIIDALKIYLTRKEDLDVPQGNEPFVTLTRLDGVNSHEVARAIISHLDDLPDRGWNRGWELLDQQLCAWMIKEGHVPATLEDLVAENYGEGKLRQMLYEMLVGKAEQLGLCHKVGDVVRFLLKSGRTVVVGSAAAAEAASIKGPGVRIRLVASESSRIARLVATENILPEEARKLIHAQDAVRARVVHEHYRRELDDHTLYDATILSDRFTPKEVARIVVEILQVRMEAHARRPPLSATQALSLV
ncbi:MAG: cytidylate kinase family protein [bacterium]